MLEFNSAYDFYSFPEEERVPLTVKSFREKSRDNLYFVLGLHDSEFNYGKQQGLVFVSPIINHLETKWFRVGVVSPDDLDLDLDFEEKEVSLHQEVIEQIKKMPKQMLCIESFC